MKKEPSLYQTLESRVLKKTPLFNLLEQRKSTPSGVAGNFIKIDSPDWVTVIALRQVENTLEILMVRQFRHGLDRLVWEFPGGMIEKGEDPAEAGLREMREETGWMAQSSLHLGSVNPNPAFMNNRANVVLAWDVRDTGVQELDPHEEVAFSWENLSEVRARMGDAEHDHGIMLMALFLLEQKRNSGTLPQPLSRLMDDSL